jgi:hypothetical protein
VTIGIINEYKLPTKEITAFVRWARGRRRTFWAEKGYRYDLYTEVPEQGASLVTVIECIRGPEDADLGTLEREGRGVPKEGLKEVKGEVITRKVQVHQ